MENKQGVIPAFPWGSPEFWREANTSLDHAMGIHGPALGRARFHSREIRILLESTVDLTHQLCAVTCPHCPEPCCGHAKVWLDFKDLLFLHLEGLSPPPTQLRTSMEGPCLYLGSRGCTLDRLCRPFVCFWYFCPPQTLRLSGMGGQEKEILDKAVTAIKIHRQAMEEAFIQTVIPTSHMPLSTCQRF